MVKTRGLLTEMKTTLASLAGTFGFMAAMVAASGQCFAAGVDYATQVQPIFSARCTGCHGAGGDGGLDLRSGNSYANLVNVASRGNPALMRVKPSDAANSVLFQYVSGGGVMGLGAADRTTVQTWINEGALAAGGGGGGGGGVNNAPKISAAASATPNPALAGQSVTLGVAATDADGDALAYAWTFGDGASGTGASVSHAYSAAGSYTATATVSDGKGGTAASSVTVTVTAGSEAGMTVLKLSGKVVFEKTDKDSAKLSGILPDVPAGFDPTGVTVTVDIGGASAQFALNAKGAAKSAAGSFKLKLKRKSGVVVGGPTAFQASLKGTFADTWADIGIDPDTTVKNEPITVPVAITLNGAVYTASYDGLMTSKEEKKASFK